MVAIYEVKDFSEWEITDEYSSSGRSRKEWLVNSEGKLGLFKYPKIHTDGIVTDEYISEKVASEIAKVLGIPCQEVDLGYYNGYIGSMNYMLLDNEKETMEEGLNFIVRKYPGYNANTLSDGEHIYSLEMIEDVLKEYDLFQNFLVIPVFDCLIGNVDRHQNNWGIIYDKNSNLKHIAPLYDNSSSICCRVKDEKAWTYFKDNNKYNALLETQSKSAIGLNNKKKVRHSEIMRYLAQNYHEEIRGVINSIEEKLHDDIIECIINDIPKELQKDNIRLLKIKFLKDKRRVILNTYKEAEK